MITFQNIKTNIITTTAILLVCTAVNAQNDTVRYVGKTLSNVDYHHGQLSPAVGVHATQIMRASREHPEKSDGFGWTYNHQPTMAYWNDTFYLQYLSDPAGEHIPPSQTLIMTSKDGVSWKMPKVIFPIYHIPDGWKKEGVEGVAKNLDAIMHQRMGFYTSKDKRLFALAYYGIAMDEKDDPNDGKGIGRVIREIKKDGSFGEIYFIRYNKSWDKSKSAFPFYTQAKDKGLKKACEEILSDPLVLQQWVEEADRDDELIPLKKPYKALSSYHLPNGNVVGLWKHALTSISKDGGKTWEYNPLRAPGFVNSNAKIWGQKTSDNRYATVYNPSEYRWPLAISTSDDGLNYKDLLLVHGEISPMRYGGNYKSAGPQYVRGISEGDGTPPDGKLWVSYSMNKEDIWVASIPVPVTSVVAENANDIFNDLPDGQELKLWNTYDLAWASTKIEKKADGKKWLTLRDQDNFDYARAERVIPFAEKMEVTFTVKPEQNNHGLLQVEFQNKQGLPAVRLVFDSDGQLKAKNGARFGGVTKYEAGKEYKVNVKLNVKTRSYTIKVNDEKESTRIFYAPVDGFERIMFRTGEQRYSPNADTEPDTDDYDDLPQTGKLIPEAVFNIESLITKKL
ncbi:BNR repeat-like domain-containing protein [Flavobacterium sp. CF108]|uniref:six-hairpin glycosidase n=1 Tax=unclassified Flavobacterium TaxID=196869 RepID=UPI0008D2E993|nr:MULTISPECIES: six-hairpin glycosidase [unclassified Flavobacterium]SEO67037.1 BNR repeat-like domain-containing protein [Flavobacterium sp. fv08]SHH89094.1 BNR repeat-like domain-containing protein [Flavobacterium sp. CF108]